MAPAKTTNQGRKLTLLQQRFVHEYLVDGNATQAAIRAGYAPKDATQSGSRLLRYAHVARAVQEGEAERIAIRDAENDPQKLISIAYVLDKLTENLERALQARPVLNRDGEKTGEYQYNGSVANKSLELMGRYLRLWSDDDSARRAGPVMNVKRVEVYLDRGQGGPPVLEGKAREVDALSPGFDGPPAAEEQAPS